MLMERFLAFYQIVEYSACVYVCVFKYKGHCFGTASTSYTFGGRTFGGYARYMTQQSFLSLEIAVGLPIH